MSSRTPGGGGGGGRKGRRVYHTQDKEGEVELVCLIEHLGVPERGGVSYT